MNGLARVSVETGELFLPVDTPYDQDLLFEHLQSIAGMHRQVQVELERLRLRVRENPGYFQRCARCARPIQHGAVCYVIARRSLCCRCARALVRYAERRAGDGGMG